MPKVKEAKNKRISLRTAECFLCGFKANLKGLASHERACAKKQTEIQALRESFERIDDSDAGEMLSLYLIHYTYLASFHMTGYNPDSLLNTACCLLSMLTFDSDERYHSRGAGKWQHSTTRV